MKTPAESPITRAEAEDMIDRAIAAHTRDGIVASVGGAVLLVLMVWAVASA
jgi:hypothetical protein